MALVTALALSACASAPVAYVAPPPGHAATLRVDEPDFTALRISPDGAHCGPAYALPPALDPLQRADHTIALPVGGPVAIEATWTMKWLHACDVTLRFTPVAGGAYRLGHSPTVESCEAFVTAQEGTHTPPVTSSPVRRHPLWPGECLP